MFYDSTMRISSSSYVTSHMYMKEMFGIGKKIRQYSESSDVSIRSMAMRMKAKYDKYWGNPNGINILLLITIVLDPKSKLDFVNYFIDYIFESECALLYYIICDVSFIESILCYTLYPIVHFFTSIIDMWKTPLEPLYILQNVVLWILQYES